MNQQGDTQSVDADVLVIGGGPAGSTVAALLAKKGWRVMLFDKDQHPRFHIGESLLPQNVPLLDRLGVLEQVEACSMVKYGIEFVSPFHGKKVQYEFAKAWGRRFPHAFQVRRSSFDHILLQNASKSGTQVYESCQVKSVELHSGMFPEVITEDVDGRQHHWTAKYIVDATGRDTFLASKFGAKKPNQRNKSAAIFAHFSGAQRLPGKAEGHITIVWFAEGWFWFIPLADGITSVGAVCSPEFLKTRKTDLTSFFYSIIAMSPEISSRLQDATMVGKVSATGNYSYTSSMASGSNYLMVGDATGFIDPVFSTGVYLAMRGGFSAAETIDTCLRHPERSKAAMRRYEASIRHAMGAFTWFIYRIRQPAMRNLFMSPRNTLRMEEAVLFLLAGGVSGGWQVSLRLYLFRAIYYATKFSHFLRGVHKTSASPG